MNDREGSLIAPSKQTHVKNRTLTNFSACSVLSFLERRDYVVVQRVASFGFVVTFARKFKIDHQPIGDATRISVQLGHYVGIFGNVLKEKEHEGHPGSSCICY